jgi:hypothetical protein
MRNKIQFLLLSIAFFCWLGYAGVSANTTMPLPSATPTATPTPPLNTIKIGNCSTPDAINSWINTERKSGLMMDARPFAINQSTGKTAFTGSAARVSIAHMNPFVYNYRITVAQQELVSTALTDFLKLLLPESLTKVVGPQSGTLTVARVLPMDKLTIIEQRLDARPSECVTPSNDKKAACSAINAMYDDYNAIKAAIHGPINTSIKSSSFAKKGGASVAANQEFINYTKSIGTLRDEEADAYATCTAATNLNMLLSSYDFDSYFNNLDAAQQVISQITALSNDLKSLADGYAKDDELKKIVIRCKGFNCVDQFKAYADAVLEVLGSYQAELDTLRQNATDMQNMYLLTEQMKNKEGLFARTFTITKKFELSQATVAVNREKLKQSNPTTSDSSSGAQTGRPVIVGRTPEPVAAGGESSEGSAPNTLASSFLRPGLQSGTPVANATPSATPPAKASEKAGNLVPTGQITEGVQIGRPRFTLSGGLVYSPLPRRTFQSVKGFARDAQGNPTGNGSANVVGFGENSSRRLLPMVLLNSRLLSYEPTSIYFSVGVSAKRDDNVDVEYLFGPSISLLNDRALFSFGAYGGKTQNLVSDIKVGDELPGDIGDAKLFRKSYTWKPGFSFSYAFSRTTKKSGEGGTAGSTSPADDLRNEIRIGNIPFNLAVGLVYTSLEQRTYDEIVGFARDRQGNLTNGQTLTRIVGLTSSSNYRMTPAALLHSRLTHFGGGYDFYFSTGITGKKTDNAFDIEYLLGGSVNLYQRKVFLTIGAFAGKQQILGGDFFEGAKLGQSQNVTLQNRYVWKPAISISYDISKIIPRP